MTDIDDDQVTFRPTEGPQRQALASEADITIFGGAAGGGKTAALVAAAARGMADPGWSAVLFRRTYPELDQQGGVIDQSQKFYPAPEAHFNKSKARWNFPSGATVDLSHLQHEDDKAKWDGAELTFVGFDQLESFERSQFFHLVGRLRSPDSSFEPRAMATCNPPPGQSHWLYQLIEWFLDDDGYPDHDRAGQLRWFHRRGDDFRWVDGPDVTADDGSPPLSLTFIPSTVEDNPFVSDKYQSHLNSLSEAERQRKRFGRWGVSEDDSPLAGHAIQTVPEPPDDATGWVRYWDLADTEPDPDQSGEPSHTASVQGAEITREWTVCEAADDESVCRWWCEGAPPDDRCPACGEQKLSTTPRTVLVVRDPVWFQLSGAEKEQRIASTADRDGTGVTQGIEQEPGSSGKDVIRKFDRRVLTDHRVEGDRPTGSKRDRQQLWLPLAETGRLWVVDGPKAGRFLAALEAMDPQDLVDAVSGVAKLAGEAADAPEVKISFL